MDAAKSVKGVLERKAQRQEYAREEYRKAREEEHQRRIDKYAGRTTKKEHGLLKWIKRIFRVRE